MASKEMWFLRNPERWTKKRTELTDVHNLHISPQTSWLKLLDFLPLHLLSTGFSPEYHWTSRTRKK